MTWLEKTLKLRTSRARACSRVRAVDGAVVSNPTAKKTTSRSGLSTAIRRASSGEYTKRTSAPSALALSRLPWLPGHPHHVAERGEDDARLLGDRDGVVDPAHGDDAHRAARPVDQFDRGGQDVLDAVPVDGVRVPPAHLHELELVVAGQLRDPRHQRPGCRRVPVFVDEAHGLGPRRPGRSGGAGAPTAPGRRPASSAAPSDQITADGEARPKRRSRTSSEVLITFDASLNSAHPSRRPGCRARSRRRLR